MIELLAIIGLVVIVLWLGKKMTRVGNALVKIGESLVDRSVTQSFKSKSGPETDKLVKDLGDRLRNTKGEETDDEYLRKIHDEIEEITRQK